MEDNIHSVRDSIRSMLKTYQIENKFEESKLLQTWSQIVGETVNQQTKRVFFSKHILYVEIDSPSLKNDMFLNKQAIYETIIQKFDREFIRDIVFL